MLLDVFHHWKIKHGLILNRWVLVRLKKTQSNIFLALQQKEISPFSVFILQQFKAGIHLNWGLLAQINVIAHVCVKT